MPIPATDVRVLIAIPAYREEKNIGAVVGSIRDRYPYDILVVNDGSPDGTSEAARNAGAIVLDLPCNLGIGGAVQTSFLYALEHGYDAVVRLDGDGQHEAGDIARILDPILQGTAEAAIGSRFLGETEYRPPVLRMMGIRFFRVLVNLFTGYRVTDPTSGFFAINRRLMEFYSAQYPSDYPEVDSYILMHRLKARAVEVPARMYEREEGKSSITPFRAMYYMVNVTLSFLITCIRRFE
ncbi:MAG: glycosyl transferase family 2 [Deltaproteobacteria bacterium]|nr:glycosyl transferase family 2 [Deltaproteobacteria bacterium]MBS1245272.1 glycosyl transferase family 2 [Deltaproteobacteria bacterium]